MHKIKLYRFEAANLRNDSFPHARPPLERRMTEPQLDSECNQSLPEFELYFSRKIFERAYGFLLGEESLSLCETEFIVSIVAEGDDVSIVRDQNRRIWTCSPSNDSTISRNCYLK